MMWTGFNWLRIDSVPRSCENGNEHPGCIKDV